jgi:hypothetical protein
MTYVVASRERSYCGVAAGYILHCIFSLFTRRLANRLESLQTVQVTLDLQASIAASSFE